MGLWDDAKDYLGWGDDNEDDASSSGTSDYIQYSAPIGPTQSGAPLPSRSLEKPIPLYGTEGQRAETAQAIAAALTGSSGSKSSGRLQVSPPAPAPAPGTTVKTPIDWEMLLTVGAVALIGWKMLKGKNNKRRG